MTVRPERRIRFVPFTVGKTKARALLEACRSHGVTMQGALGAAQLLAINDEFDSAAPRNLALNSLADLRGLLGGQLTQQDLGLYIATVSTVHAIPAEPDFWRLAADVSEPAQGRSRAAAMRTWFTPSIARARSIHPTRSAPAWCRPSSALAPPSSMLTNAGPRSSRWRLLADGRDASPAELTSWVVLPPARASDVRHGVDACGRGSLPLNLACPSPACKIAAAAQARRLAPEGAMAARRRAGGQRLEAGRRGEGAIVRLHPRPAVLTTPAARSHRPARHAAHLARPGRCAARRVVLDAARRHRRADRRIGLRQDASPRWR